MSSNVVCGYSGADWEENSLGQNACEVYAQLAGKCDSNFEIDSVETSDPPYTPNNDACTCNLIAYNLQAGCAWCQSSIPDGWWLTEAQWAGNCTSVTYDPNGIPSSVSTSGIVFPPWAVISVPGSWSPSVEDQLTSAAPTSRATSSRSFSYTYNPYTHNYDDDWPYSWDYYSNAGVAAYAVVLGVIFGLYALVAIIVGAAYYYRQKKRKAWYGPMATFYRNSGAGGYRGSYADPASAPYRTPYENDYPPAPYSGPQSAPLLQNTDYKAPVSPPTNTNSLYNPSPSPGFHSTPYQPPPSTGSGGYQPPPPQGHTSMYGPPPGAPGAGGYSGKAEVY